MKMTAIVLLLVCLGGARLNAKKQQYAWQTGRLVEETRYPRYCYLGDCREFVDGERLVIEAGDVLLTLEHAMIRHPQLTVRGSVGFAQKKGAFFVRDERGRIFEFKLVRKELK